MVMPTSGPISIGQARNETRLGNPVSASQLKISKLAGVSPGQRFAWSWWRGRSGGFVNQLFATASVHTDRGADLLINFRTGSITARDSIYVRGGEGRLASTPVLAMDPVADIAGFSSVSMGYNWAITYQEKGNSSRSDGRFLSIRQQPDASNDYTGIILVDDNDAAGRVIYQFDILLTCQ